MILKLVLKLSVFSVFFTSTLSLQDEGKWDYDIEKTKCIVKSKTLFQHSNVSMSVSCNPPTEHVSIKINLEESSCLFYLSSVNGDIMCLKINSTLKNEFQFNCSDQTTISPMFTTKTNGMYELLVAIQRSTENVTGKLFIEMKGPYGYLCAAKWPLLNFYEKMCIVYGIYATVWFIVTFLQWRDLLRIQFWIGAVILIGMMEKAMFYEEYQSINSTGKSSLLGTVLVPEIFSAAKRALARMLVIIVSLGYGIVKSRLGSHFIRVLIVGVLYFILASTEAYLRVYNPGHISLLLAAISLALLDSFICWWIFSSLIQTIRTLRLRRNLVKLQLYNYFMNTLIFAVLASTIFMLYSIKVHQIAHCLTDWENVWIDDAFWHSLFSIILLVIMILWRPTNNNQRYAFSPLLDAIDDDDDDDDDDEIEHFVNDKYGVKMRGVTSYRSESPKSKNNADEDLKWVEENIPPSFIDSALPILDSDEELMNTKFEISKMQ